MTIENECFCSQADLDISSLTPCNHEEADTRLFLHLAHTVQEGHTSVLMRSSDSDVASNGTKSTAQLIPKGLEELWIAFGQGAYFRYIPVHEIVAMLGSQMSLALPGFHAFTGCDSTSAFYGKGMKKAWSVWQSYPAVTEAFLYLSQPSPQKQHLDRILPTLHVFVNKLYGVSEDSAEDVDGARLVLLVHHGKSFEDIPPSSDTLYQKVLRTAFQSGHIWGNMHQRDISEESPMDWGWHQPTENSPITPLYVTTPILSSAMPELSSCGCRNEICKGNCVCIKHKYQCSMLCKCHGRCVRK